MELAVEEGGLEHDVGAGTAAPQWIRHAWPAGRRGPWTGGSRRRTHRGRWPDTPNPRNCSSTWCSWRSPSTAACSSISSRPKSAPGSGPASRRACGAAGTRTGGRDQVGGRVDQVPASPGGVGVEQKHGASLHKYGSCQPGRRRGPPNDIPPPSGACRHVKKYQPVPTVSEGCAGVPPKVPGVRAQPSPVPAGEAGRCAACYAM